MDNMDILHISWEASRTANSKESLRLGWRSYEAVVHSNHMKNGQKSICISLFLLALVEGRPTQRVIILHLSTSHQVSLAYTGMMRRLSLGAIRVNKIWDLVPVKSRLGSMDHLRCHVCTWLLWPHSAISRSNHEWSIAHIPVDRITIERASRQWQANAPLQTLYWHPLDMLARLARAKQWRKATVSGCTEGTVKSVKSVLDKRCMLRRGRIANKQTVTKVQPMQPLWRFSWRQSVTVHQASHASR
jgi:hypothetical protein